MTVRSMFAALFALTLLLAACGAEEDAQDTADADAEEVEGEAEEPEATDDDAADDEPHDEDEGEEDDDGDGHSHDDNGDDHDHAHDDDDDHDHGDGEDSHDHDDGGTGEAAEVDSPAHRLLVADAEAGQVSVLAVGSGETVETIEVAEPDSSPTALAKTADGRYGFAVQFDHGVVHTIDGGVWEESHGDHGHYYEGPVEPLGGYEGGGPAHVVSHGDQTAIFFDDDGEYLRLDTAGIAHGEESGLLAADVPHHGVAVPWDEERTIVTQMGDTDPEETTLPPEVVVHDAEGEVIEDGFPACPEMHGEATLGNVAAFACEDGVLLLDEHGDHFHGHYVDYPDGDGRAGTLAAADGVDVLVGNYSDDAFVVVDPEAHTAELIDIPEPFTGFTVTGHEGGRLLGLSASGALHVVDIASGEATSIEGVTGETDPDADWTDPAPQLAAGPDALAFVSDPEAGQVHEVDLETGEVTDSYDVDGVPFNLAVLGQ